MSFKRLETDDFVISADAITGVCWDKGVTTLTTFFTSSTQAAASSGDYYLNIQDGPDSSTSESVQFAIAYGNKVGSGSIPFNSGVTGKSPSSTIYGQYRTMVNEDENTDFAFGNYTGTEFIAISIDRARYKESLFPGSLNLHISGNLTTLKLTDNSKDVTTTTFVGSNRVFQLVSGSNGSAFSGLTPSNGQTPSSGSYGWFLPDTGLILLNSAALEGAVADGGCGLPVTKANTSNLTNNQSFYNALVGGANFQINSQETITSDFVFVRPRSSEFNYSENPSFISGSTGEVIYNDFIDNPQTFITTVGLYNDTNDLLAVAKLSKPLIKDFTKESLIRVKLDF
jgi:hypothetical protein